jgi:alkylation response protein AidB-like acyl-CoA dehydrogenase
MSASRATIAAQVNPVRLVAERAARDPLAIRLRRAEIFKAIQAAAPGHDRHGSFPFENFARLHEGNLLALTVGPEYGGGGAGLAEVGEQVGALGAVCPSTALVFSMQAVHQKAISRKQAWPAHLREKVARSAVERGALINALRVEPALGTPARGGLPATVATRTDAGWSISGRKIYSTGSPGLTWMLVWARSNDPQPKVGQFLVPAHSKGIRIDQTWDHLGLRASGSHDVVFDGVIIPEDHAVDVRAPAEWAVDGDQAAWNAVTIGSLYTGIARAARDWLVFFLNDRVPANLGASLATLPRMQEAVGAIEALLATNTRLIEAIASAHDRGLDFPATECHLLKNVIAENAIDAVQQAVKLGGNHALSRANPLERHLRDVLCARIHTPQADSAEAAAGRAALGQ